MAGGREQEIIRLTANEVYSLIEDYRNEIEENSEMFTRFKDYFLVMKTIEGIMADISEFFSLDR